MKHAERHINKPSRKKVQKSFCLLGFCMKFSMGATISSHLRLSFAKDFTRIFFLLFFLQSWTVFQAHTEIFLQITLSAFPPSFHLCTYTEIQEPSHINTQGPPASESRLVTPNTRSTRPAGLWWVCWRVRPSKCL